MYGKKSECRAHQTIPIILNTCTWNKLWFNDKLTTGLDTKMQQKLMKVHNGTCHNRPDTAPIDIWPSHGALAVPENDKLLYMWKYTCPSSTTAITSAHGTVTLGQQMLYWVTQKKRELLKNTTKIEEIQGKKFIDRNWTITTCLLRDSTPNYHRLKITSCRWRPPPRMHSFTATTHFKSSRSFVSPCVCCIYRT